MQREAIERAVQFIDREGRVLERRILEAVLHGRPAGPVADALRGYQNGDGGFGYGLEPDKRAPDSQPLDVEIAWESLDWARIAPTELIEPACDYLASLGAGVSCITASATDYPQAPHWSDASYEPSLNPTASLAGFLWKWSIEHRWRAAATDFCWAALGAGPPADAHSAIGVMRFLEYVPDRERAQSVVDALHPTLRHLTWLHYDAGNDGYGVSPLQLVPDPRSPWRDLFPVDVIEQHLDHLEKTQADDGGWVLTWPTIGAAANSEWRSRRTLQNLLVLRSYGRLD